MPTIAPNMTDLEDQFREKLCEILREPRFTLLDSVATSRALVASAFAFRDYNGGIDDTCHAAKCLHQLVDAEGARRHQDYSPEKMRNYLRMTGQY